jgi:acetyl esterase/lipase
VIDWLFADGCQGRGVHPDRIAGGGDSVGSSMTAAICLRRLDRGKRPLAAQVLLYPEAGLPFDTPAAADNSHGYYLQCNGVFGFADRYLPRPNGPSPLDRYVCPGTQGVSQLGGQPPAVVFTGGFDPLRDVGIEYARKLCQAGVPTQWRHYDDLAHGWVQMTAWSQAAREATQEVGAQVRRLLYGEKSS